MEILELKYTITAIKKHNEETQQHKGKDRGKTQ